MALPLNNLFVILKFPEKLKMVSIVNGKSIPLKEKLKDGDEVILVIVIVRRMIPLLSRQLLILL